MGVNVRDLIMNPLFLSLSNSVADVQWFLSTRIWSHFSYNHVTDYILSCRGVKNILIFILISLDQMK